MVSIRYWGPDAVRRAVPHSSAAELDCVWYTISRRCSLSGFGRRGLCAIIVPVQTERHRSPFAREKLTGRRGVGIADFRIQLPLLAVS